MHCATPLLLPCSSYRQLHNTTWDVICHGFATDCCANLCLLPPFSRHRSIRDSLRLQHLQHFSWRNNILPTMRFFLLTCWICWIPLAINGWIGGGTQIENVLVYYIRLQEVGCPGVPKFGCTGKTHFYNRVPEKCHSCDFWRQPTRPWPPVNVLPWVVSYR